MTEITNVDLRFQRKTRGASPLSRFAADDDGAVTLAVSDAIEVRTLHLARYDSAGTARIAETYGVETLRKTEVCATGGGIGITDDDLYLFRDSRKSRFLPDRRASYGDIALAANGQRFVAAFTDMLASGHAVAWGDIAGRALWTKDVGFPITRVAVDRAAAYLAVAGETGELLLLDTARNTVLRFQSDAPIAAVATTGPSRTLFASEAGVGAVDSDGRLVWFQELDGIPVEVATDAEGRTSAVILRTGEASGRLALFSAAGLPVWDLDFEEARPTGLSLSPNGAFAAVTLRDGTLNCFALEYGARLATTDGGTVLERVRTARETGDFAAAVALLRDRLRIAPGDLAACDALSEAIADLRSRNLAAASVAEAVQDFATADRRLDDILEAAPLDAEIVARRAELRMRWTSSARERGAAALLSGDGPEAEARLLEAIAADPANREARSLLHEARASANRAGIAQAQALINAGNYPGAVEALTEMQARAADSPELPVLLRAARVGQALALGNALYGDRQYAAALFQFKKVLRFDPGNEDAMQKIRYSQNFLQDTQLSDRFTRLE
jgi:tetratricopeptide (TPR) repeat protein